MKKLLTLLLVFFTALFIFPQQTKYFDAPFGGGGGYIPGWYIPKMDALNGKLNNFGVENFSSSGFYTSGGAGFLYVPWLPYLRIGGMGFGGSTSNSASVNGFEREAVYSLSGGGLTVEYTLPFVRSFGISVGALIGAGSMQIDLYSSKNNFNWDDVWTNASNSSTQNVNRSLINNYWILSPTLNVDIPFYRFIVFRIGVGYQLTLGENWTADNDKNLSNVPSDLSGNSFFIQSGLFIGIFSF